MRVKTLLSGAAIAAIASAAGCIGKPTPSQKLFVLPTTAPGDAGPREGVLRDRSMGLGPVTVASHLARSSVPVRLAETRYEYADSMHWASPVHLLIQERLLERLVWATGTRDIRRFPWVAGSAPDVQIAARFVRFELTPEGSADLSVYWQIRDGQSGEQVTSGRFDHQEPIRGASADAGVEALDRGLLLLAETLTRAMRE